MLQQSKLYETDGVKKFLYFLGIFLGILILLFIIVIIFSIKLSIFAAALGGAFASIFSMFPKIYVDEDKVYYSIMLHKFDCPFDQGQFQIVEKTGIHALLLNLSTQTVGIEYTPNNSIKKTAFGWMLKESEVREIYAYIQAQQNTQTDHAVKSQ